MPPQGSADCWTRTEVMVAFAGPPSTGSALAQKAMVMMSPLAILPPTAWPALLVQGLSGVGA
jgi:hypothetical protein